MNKIITTIALVLMCCITAGCATPRQRIATTSGKPEIVISGTTKKQIIDLLISDKLNNGFQIKNVNEYSLVIAKDIDDFGAKVVYGSKLNRTPEARITYNFVDVTGGVKVFVRSEMITNPNSQYEKISDFTSTWGEHAQRELTEIKAKLEKGQ